MSDLKKCLSDLGYKETASQFLAQVLEKREETIQGLLKAKDEETVVNTLGNFSSLMSKALITMCLDPAVDTDSRDNGTDIGDGEIIASVVTPIIFEVCLMLLTLADNDFKLTKTTIDQIVHTCLKECETILKDLGKIQGTDTDGKRGQQKPSILN